MDLTTGENKCVFVGRLYLVFLIFSFAGWVWEVIHVSILAGELVDRGFLFGPICPIYGLTMVIAYFLIGMPKKPKGILKATEGKWYQYLLYGIAAITLPTLVELVVGYGCELIFGIRLWDYSHYVLAVNGRDLMALGFAPGKKLGNCLQNLFERVLDERLPNERAALLACAEAYLSQEVKP